DFLGQFEKGISHLVEEGLLRVLPGALSPLEVAKRLERVMEEGKFLGVSRIYVPSRYRVLLHPDDEEMFRLSADSLREEFTRYLHSCAEKAGYEPSGPFQIVFEASDAIRRGRFQVEAGASHGLQLLVREGYQKGKIFLCAEAGETILGRGEDAEVRITDPRVSHQHAAIFFKDGKPRIRDLESKNGTVHSGHEIQESALSDGDLVEIGDTILEVVWKGSGER
ncbi:MAG: DUF3662 and FHA domain-containing protein, partial [Armatimonadetes bacterium]|nr:DUF3662 and FHA domain-containing protein [Armatimonadota bacterium]